MMTSVVEENHRIDEEKKTNSLDLPTSLDDSDDPFLRCLEAAQARIKVAPPEPPKAKVGFGLLPYLRQKKLHAGLIPQPDDFTLECLRNTPEGRGKPPLRPPLPIPLEENEKKTENGVVDEDFSELNKSDGDDVAKAKCSKQFSVLEPKGKLSDPDLRAHIAKQSSLFAAKCRERKWIIEERPLYEVSEEDLEAKMEKQVERLEELQSFAFQHKGTLQDFARAVFDRRPFLDLDWENVVDSCLNTYATYRMDSKETISRKVYNSYVNSLREKLKSRPEYTPPPVIIPTESASCAKDAEIVEDNVPRSPDPEPATPLKEPPVKKLQTPKPLFTSTPVAPAHPPPPRRTIVPPPLPHRKPVECKSSSTSKAPSHDLVSGIISSMDEFSARNPPKIPDIEEDEEEQLFAIRTEVPLGKFCEEDLLRNGPSAKRFCYDGTPTPDPTASEHSPSSPIGTASTVFVGVTNVAVTDVAEDRPPVYASSSSTPSASSEEQLKPVADYHRTPKQVSFSEQVLYQEEEPPANIPNRVEPATKLENQTGPSRIPTGILKRNVNYPGADPYKYCAEKYGRGPFPAPKIKLHVSDRHIEDPYVSFPSQKDVTQSSRGPHSEEEFRSTFYSLHEYVASRNANSDFKKLGPTFVEWKLIPLARPKKQPLKAFPLGACPRDPRLAEIVPREVVEAANRAAEGGSEEEYMARTKAVLSKKYRKNPIRCFEDKGVSNLCILLELRPYCRRPSYPPNRWKLTAEEQGRWNKQKERSVEELEWIERRVLPKWGTANPKQLIYPFGKTEGLYWPIVQPYDAINLANEKHVNCADTKNQLVCLTEYSFALKQPLLCGRDDGYHYQRYMRAVQAEETRTQLPGRFRNRIGFVRVFSEQTMEDAREKDQALQEKEHAWNKRLSEEADGINFLLAENDSMLQRAYEPKFIWIKDHVDFNITDFYSPKSELIFGGSNLRIPSRGTRGPLKVPRNWIEVPLEQYMSSIQRKDYLVEYTNFRNRLAHEFRPRVKPTFDAYDDLVQYHLRAIEAIFVHQVSAPLLFKTGLKGVCPTSFLNERILQKARQRNRELATEMKSDKISLKRLKELCELQDWELEYWTIIWDNLANMYKDAPPISQLKLDNYINKAFENSVNINQRGAYFNRFWEIVEHNQIS
ncbi:unnamed protein product [Cylicocyclus nassatus]|uniref:Uncharacterized protein n=1 Tax=Cylicocyclus nassatus TaxID=53992 RepID=A0AA36DRP4_CYLNA|nr:unnamed protein product [Cylicocyclus nassatus]